MLRPQVHLGILTLLLTVVVPSGVAGAEAPTNKKGFGLSEKAGRNERHLELLNVGWYYNWGLKTDLTTKAQFIPMVWSGKRSVPQEKVPVLLGFNEPDHPKQANLDVAEALMRWPQLAAKADYVVSPALAGNPVTKDWLADFMKGKPRVDAIALHWYKGPDVGRFIQDLEQTYARFKKPIWVTEFAAQTHASSVDKPTAFSHAQVKAFILGTTRFMEKTPWVHRYAWHDPGVGTSALFTEAGELTPTGRAYAEVK